MLEKEALVSKDTIDQARRQSDVGYVLNGALWVLDRVSWVRLSHNFEQDSSLRDLLQLFPPEDLVAFTVVGLYFRPLAGEFRVRHEPQVEGELLVYNFSAVNFISA